MKLLSVLPVAFMRIMPLIAPAIAVPLLARPTGDEEGAFPPLTDPATPAPGNVSPARWLLLRTMFGSWLTRKYRCLSAPGPTGRPPVPPMRSASTGRAGPSRRRSRTMPGRRCRTRVPSAVSCEWGLLPLTWPDWAEQPELTCPLTPPREQRRQQSDLHWQWGGHSVVPRRP